MMSVPTTGHVGRDGDGAFTACLGDDVGFTAMLFWRSEPNASMPRRSSRSLSRSLFLDADGTDQHGATGAFDSSDLYFLGLFSGLSCLSG